MTTYEASQYPLDAFYNFQGDIIFRQLKFQYKLQFEVFNIVATFKNSYSVFLLPSHLCLDNYHHQVIFLRCFLNISASTRLTSIKSK